MSNNFQRVFADLVSVEAWHAEFDDRGRASVHVDLSFREGEIGAEDEFQITFRLALKRATLQLVIPPNEPIAVVQSSVSREATMTGMRRVVSKTGIGRAFNADARLNMAGVLPAVHGKLSGERSSAENIELQREISEFDFRQYQNDAGAYCWEVTEFNGRKMVGKVWDPVKDPRLQVKKTRESRMPPTLEARITCRRCDFVIDDVRPKKEVKMMKRLMENRTAAAHAVIREKILGLGLDHPEPDNDFIELVIARRVIVEEVA